jgi:hypothetical protein
MIVNVGIYLYYKMFEDVTGVIRNRKLQEKHYTEN